MDLDRFWWNCRIDFKIPVQNPGPRSESDIWVHNSDRNLDPGSKIEAHLRHKGAGIRECIESIFGASKNRKSKNAQNEILDVRKCGQKVVKTTLGPS